MSDPGATGSEGAPAPSVIHALTQAKLFEKFTPTGVEIIASVAEEKILPPHTPLFVENMMGEELFIIAQGEMDISVNGPNGQAPLVVLGPGDSIGEASILRRGPRLCTAIARTEVHVVEIARRDIARLQRTKPQACLKLMMAVTEVLATRLRDSDGELRRFVQWRLGDGAGQV